MSWDEVRFFQEPAYKAWRLRIYQRDKFACRKCGARGRTAKLNAHHIYRWADRPDLRYELSNGITLCKGCHDAVKGQEDIWAAVFLQLISQ